MILLWLGVLFMTINNASATQPTWPGAAWQERDPASIGLELSHLEVARDFALTGGGSGLVIRGGFKVFSWGDQDVTYDLKSSTKSIGSMALGLALLDGRVQLDDPAALHHPTFGESPDQPNESDGLARITLRQLASHTAGFDKGGGYEPVLFEPGTRWSYSDGGPNWLAECLTLAYGIDMERLLFDRLFTRMGITPEDLRWRDNSYRDPLIQGMKRCEFGAGVHANVDAMARIGLLMLRQGRWQGEQLLPRSFVDAARQPDDAHRDLEVHLPEQYGRASQHYGLLWWNNADGSLKNVPRDAYWSWGLHESFIIVLPSFDMVIARAGKDWRQDRNSDHYDILPSFLDEIMRSVEQVVWNDEPPYPRSSVVTGVEWADTTQIIRLADGSDNWPLTWADDDDLYTAYGDGWGFEPKVEKKLSLGLSRVAGYPPHVTAENIRSESGEETGQGDHGIKASGILMVDGVLYMWCRNAANSQLRWSEDHGTTWVESDWKFVDGFGAPTFLQFGQNYSGARDEYVYIYSHDDDSAYQPADGMALARVLKGQLQDRSAYTFFAGFDVTGAPQWSSAIEARQPVFESPMRCYRSGITYNAGLGRYLWSQTLGGMDPRFAGKLQAGSRFKGGLAIYDAPNPWGPWTTVYYAPLWDVGPGETSSLPPKWMSADGRTCWLVFSGEDHFSVRQATFTVNRSSSPVK